MEKGGKFVKFQANLKHLCAEIIVAVPTEMALSCC